ncbi:MAG: hypothetical protein ACYDBP_13995 [Leptospirales bacterium]
MLNKIFNNYKNLFDIIHRYWSAYGGFRAFLSSPYFHASLGMCLLLKHYWMEKPWWETTLSVLPSVLGFTLAGFTIWLGFGDEKFRSSLMVGKDKRSHYMSVCATFAHFVIIQIIAILLAVMALAYRLSIPKTPFSLELLNYIKIILRFLGFWFFIYAIFTALAATLAVFRTATWYERISKESTCSALEKVKNGIPMEQAAKEEGVEFSTLYRISKQKDEKNQP